MKDQKRRTRRMEHVSDERNSMADFTMETDGLSAIRRERNEL